MNLEAFWLCFVPLFVAVDALGLLPLFLSFTQGFQKKHLHYLIYTSTLTAVIVGLLFLFIGEAVLRMLGITVEDFMIAGGIILFLISTSELLTTEKKLRKAQAQSLGPVPLGVPLLVGPAVLTTIMLLARQYGSFITAAAMVANILIAGFLFLGSGYIMKYIGNAGSTILSKISSLFLAAIAVMMVRKGLISLLQ
ncbi:MAG: MarC family protein [Fibrobacter sp.]|nr:MarC family protein [Fibrobacter sp.]